jgi:hypothetical protein
VARKDRVEQRAAQGVPADFHSVVVGRRTRRVEVEHQAHQRDDGNEDLPGREEQPAASPDTTGAQSTQQEHALRPAAEADRRDL